MPTFAAVKEKQSKNMKKLLIAACLMLGAIGLSACTANKSQQGKNENKETKKMNSKKILVAYFSWSGNTKNAAQYIAEKLKADTFEIVREKPYPTEYQPRTEDAKAEKEANARPKIKGRVNNMDQYDVVFVGVPVWWYTAPMPVFTFLEQYDFNGKTVIPFCTCYTAEYNTLKDIVKATPKANHSDGLTIVTHEMGGSGMNQKHSEIDKWLKSIGF